VWQGKVMLGMTLWACMVLAPRAIKACKLGHSVAVMASGRMPSIITNTTIGVSFLAIA
jgi:hypothetical protein